MSGCKSQCKEPYYKGSQGFLELNDGLDETNENKIPYSVAFHRTEMEKRAMMNNSTMAKASSGNAENAMASSKNAAKTSSNNKTNAIMPLSGNATRASSGNAGKNANDKKNNEKTQDYTQDFINAAKNLLKNHNHTSIQEKDIDTIVKIIMYNEKKTAQEFKTLFNGIGPYSFMIDEHLLGAFLSTSSRPKGVNKEEYNLGKEATGITNEMLINANEKINDEIQMLKSLLKPQQLTEVNNNTLSNNDNETMVAIAIIAAMEDRHGFLRYLEFIAETITITLNGKKNGGKKKVNKKKSKKSTIQSGGAAESLTIAVTQKLLNDLNFLSYLFVH